MFVANIKIYETLQFSKIFFRWEDFGLVKSSPNQFLLTEIQFIFYSSVCVHLITSCLQKPTFEILIFWILIRQDWQNFKKNHSNVSSTTADMKDLKNIKINIILRTFDVSH